jgi:hypothetical protein
LSSFIFAFSFARLTQPCNSPKIKTFMSDMHTHTRYIPKFLPFPCPCCFPLVLLLLLAFSWFFLCRQQ